MADEIPYCFTVSFKGLRVVKSDAKPVPADVYRTAEFQSRHLFQPGAGDLFDRMMKIAKEDVVGRMANGDVTLHMLCEGGEQASKVAKSVSKVASDVIRFTLLGMDNDSLMRMWSASSHAVTLRELTDLVAELREYEADQARELEREDEECPIRLESKEGRCPIPDRRIRLSRIAYGSACDEAREGGRPRPSWIEVERELQRDIAASLAELKAEIGDRIAEIMRREWSETREREIARERQRAMKVEMDEMREREIARQLDEIVKSEGREAGAIRIG